MCFATRIGGKTQALLLESRTSREWSEARRLAAALAVPAASVAIVPAPAAPAVPAAPY